MYDCNQTRQPADLPLTYRWELLPEATDLKNVGDRESRPAAIPGLFSDQLKS